jgi:PleD family two-component response regulator
MSGFAVCKYLKEQDETRDIPVIFITGLADATDETLAFQMGAVDYITKPFNSEVVKARIKTHILLKKQTDLLEKYAYRDGLTQLFNRRAFDERFAVEWKRMWRVSEPLSVVMFDVDHFKLFNDFYGHGIGDTCLVKISERALKNLQRAHDFLARYGGGGICHYLAPYRSRLCNENCKYNLPFYREPSYTA